MSPYWPQVDLINVRDRAFHRRGHEADSAPRLTFFVVPTISARLHCAATRCTAVPPASSIQLTSLPRAFLPGEGAVEPAG